MHHRTQFLRYSLRSVELDNGNLRCVYVYTVGFYTVCKVLSLVVEQRFRTRESAETLASTDDDDSNNNDGDS